MKISKKLSILSLLIVSSLLTLVVFSYVQISNLSKDINKNQNISTPLVYESLKFQKDVIQIQQFLTDISATRAQSGFDDGFDEAEVFYKDANLILDGLNKYGVDESFINKLRTDLDEYYKIGMEMANAYIKDGTEEGNVYMGIFDPFADDIQEEIEELIVNAENDKENMVKKINLNINKIKFLSIGLSLLVLIITLASVIIIKKSVLNRLNEFVIMFKDISEGEGDLTTVLDESSNDELGMVSKYFNSFIKRIHSMILSIKDISYETNNSAERTSIITNELSSSIGEVAINTNSVANETRSQTDTVRRVLDNIKENNEQISIGINNIDESVKLAETANELTERGFSSMSDTVSSFENMQSDINSSRDEINNLDKSVTEIGTAIDIITDISYQINLLSLNASIEAARAGEHGQGFSVVSSEIGVLAEETKQATEQISELIGKVQTDTKKTVASMELNAKNITSQRDILNQGSSAIEETKKINSLNSVKVHHVSDIFNNIDNRLVELTELCEYMLEGADSTQSSSEAVAASIEEQLSALEEVSSQMNHMRNNSNDLDLKLNEFIV